MYINKSLYSMYIAGKGKESHTYDAIVVGSGISGGWAAKELTEKGLKVAMIDRGRNVEHIKDYTTATSAPWELPHRGNVDNVAKQEYWAGARNAYTIAEGHRQFFVKDVDYPYEESKKFDWIRGYQTGGRSIMWGRQCYRWSQADFIANEVEGIGTPWPIGYKDLEPWYSYVEKFIGVSGSKENLEVLPDSDFQPAMELNCLELDVKQKLEKKYSGRKLIIGRAAHLTAPTAQQTALGRGSCQNRNMCMRGCPYGAYFSTQSSTLPAAKKTGNLTLINDKIVFQVIFDAKTGKATGVKTIDEKTNEEIEFYAKVIFLNASSMNTAWIMLQSTSARHPNGLGNTSDQLGRNVMDHHKMAGARGTSEAFDDMYYYGRRPSGIYIPRFVNWGSDKRDFVRGFGYQGGASRTRGAKDEQGFGLSYKAAQNKLGHWEFSIHAYGETLPHPDNRMTLSTIKDKWGLPIIKFDAQWRENELKMRIAMEEEAKQMLESSGIQNVKSFNDKSRSPGNSIHEMGTARMGTNEKNSCLNKHNQVWGAPNVFVTDGAGMVSSSCVNPSLTYMALTARAASYAVEELKKNNL
jgi:choline dehydrogenase-like flavoprotein